MYITRTRTASGTTAKVTDTLLFDENRGCTAVRRPLDVDDEGYDSICDMGSIPPSNRFYDSDVPNRCSEVPDDTFVDTPDLVTDVEMEEEYYTYNSREHRNTKYNHPYVLAAEVFDRYGLVLTLDCDYAVAARQDNEVGKLLFANYYGKHYTKEKWEALKKQLDWKHQEDDLKPLQCGEREPLVCERKRIPVLNEKGRQVYRRDRYEGVYDYRTDRLVYPYAYPLYNYVEYDIAGEEIRRWRSEGGLSERVVIKGYEKIRQVVGDGYNDREFLRLAQ